MQTSDAEDRGTEVDRGSQQAAEGGDGSRPEEAVHEPAKLVRMARMIHELLGELREAELDDDLRERLRARLDQTAAEAEQTLSPELRDELARLRSRWNHPASATQAELRIEHAQVAGWLQGLLQGVQDAVSQEQTPEQASAEEAPGPRSPFGP